MKKAFWLMALVGAMLLGAGPVLADGELYVIAGGGAPVGTKITSVPYTINNPGFYFLTGNLTNSGNFGIHVMANDVTIDLMGFSLTSTNSAFGVCGIRIFQGNNVEVRNGTVRGFYNGIQEDKVSALNHRVSNVRAIGNIYAGIFLAGSNHLVENCTVSNNNSMGIEMYSGIITGCAAYNNNWGILLVGPGSVIGNTANNNASYNFWFGGVGVVGATSILVNNNSAFGTSPNYRINPGLTGVVITANNSGTP
jgi:hypothetical protein